jgi:hypothetical protein
MFIYFDLENVQGMHSQAFNSVANVSAHSQALSNVLKVGPYFLAPIIVLKLGSHSKALSKM